MFRPCLFLLRCNNFTMYYTLVFASVGRVHCACIVFVSAAAVCFGQGYSAGFAYTPPLASKGSVAAWEILVCIGTGLLVSGISDGLSNFFVVITCIAVAVSWVSFSNVTAGLLFLLLYLFLLMAIPFPPSPTFTPSP